MAQKSRFLPTRSRLATPLNCTWLLKISVVEQIYAHCGLTLSDQRKAALVEHRSNNPQAKHGEHRYSLGEFGLENAAIRAHYAAYEGEFVD